MSTPGTLASESKRQTHIGREDTNIASSNEEHVMPHFLSNKTGDEAHTFALLRARTDPNRRQLATGGKRFVLEHA